MDNKEVKNNSKKRNHFFEIFIIKVLKQIVENSGITSNAKQQLNSFICIICKHISLKAKELTIFYKKKTISEKEIKNALELTFIGGILENCISEGEKSVTQFKNCDKDIKGSRQSKSGILFSPSITEKFLRNFGYAKIMVSSLAPIYLAAALEYLTYEILDLSLNYSKEDKRVRITLRDIELGVRNDEELLYIVNKINISFLGGGVISYIHPSLFNKKKKKKNLLFKDKQKHRFRPGTIAIRDIKKYQKMSEYLIFAKSPFEKLVRQIFNDHKNSDSNFKISKDVFIIIQHFIEQYIVKLFYNSNFLAIHAGRIKLLPIDIVFMSYLTNNSKNPYLTTEKDESTLLNIQEELLNNTNI